MSDAFQDQAVEGTGGLRVRRLGPEDRELARATFALMAAVFGEEHTPLSDAYLDRLLRRDDLWAYAATCDGAVIAGMTAHTLVMTAFEGAEIFLYDIAVSPVHQRRGVGRALIDRLRRDAIGHGVSAIFVPAEDEDAGAIEFYSALGGRPSHVTFFEFDAGE
jgi:aminoglycoside 3-N-acetyltransferase I